MAAPTRQALDAKRVRLESLLARRARLTQALDAVNRQIAVLKGSIRPQKPGRSTNPHALIHYVVEILERHKRGLDLKELGEQVLAAGYKTESANFRQTLYQNLYSHRNKVTHDRATGTYRLVEP
jgi:hypothetical protein